MIDPASHPEDFKRPGHIFPLRAKAGGVLEREGHTEAAVDLARLAGLYPAGVICEIIQTDGTMARLPQLMELAAAWDLKIISIADLISYRQQQECPVQRVATVNMPTEYGDFTMVAYSAPDSAEPHLALVKGDITHTGEPVLVRVHSECMTGDLFGSKRCDCGSQLARSLQKINEVGCGILLYLRQEGRGIGLLNKLKAYELQEQGYDTVEANIQLGFAPESRDFGVGAAILRDLRVERIRLMTNNPLKIEALRQHGIIIASREALEISPNCTNVGYLKTKEERMGHIFRQSPIVNMPS
jgi:3,4-dihydroxy 2-butanone 4-phosphate synthase/GTP cyclohydrolase II